MKFITTLLVTLFCVTLHAQKRIDKIIDAQDITTLQINGDNCFKIHVTASNTSRITIQTNIAGEHNEEMLVIAKTSNDSLYVSTGFHPLFQADNDKLSAHKVMSIELEIQVPKHIKLNIKSNIGSVKIKGDFNTAFIELNQGQCVLNSFIGSAKINTIQGGISVETNFAKVNAASKHGVVKLEPLIFGENQLDLKSIRGDISVFKTE
ncbi:hypothetical protein ACFFVB_01840 [Formosa undariae]|uniref:DUF4097 domain-containing protein n=1 Tax=Formosa undariae TaxID=1325436 RepID=A0ABV5EXB3_9FLAO